MLTVNIFLYFQHSSEPVNMRFNQNVQFQYRFNIGLYPDMRFLNLTYHQPRFDMNITCPTTAKLSLFVPHPQIAYQTKQLL